MQPLSPQVAGPQLHSQRPSAFLQPVIKLTFRFIYFFIYLYINYFFTLKNYTKSKKKDLFSSRTSVNWRAIGRSLRDRQPASSAKTTNIPPLNSDNPALLTIKLDCKSVTTWDVFLSDIFPHFLCDIVALTVTAPLLQY